MRAPPDVALRVRFVGLEGRTARAEFLRFLARVFEHRARVSVDELSSFDPLEAVPFQERGVRCFQQRPGNSTGPKVDVAPPFSTDRVLDRHIRDLDVTSRGKHAE